MDIERNLQGYLEVHEDDQLVRERHRENVTPRKLQ